MTDTDGMIRRPAVAGTFYPADSGRLLSDIESYLQNVDLDRSAEDIVALVAPHAGYIYSGGVAAHAYRQVHGSNYDTVVVISPSHREYFEFSSVFDGDAYQTPLGTVEIDHALSQLIGSRETDNLRISTSGHLHSAEHALEVHLPFLQAVLDSFKLVAIVMGRQDEEACRGLGRALGSTLSDKRALIVASSDLSHFHNRQTAESLDHRVVDRINDFDPQGLLEDVAANDCEACGAGPVAAAMFAARELGAKHSENICYANSGDVSGDYSQVVGYTAGIIYR